MSAITNCPRCGALYEESSEELANAPYRECAQCWAASRAQPLQSDEVIAKEPA